MAEIFNLSQQEKERATHLHKKSIVVDTLAGGPEVFSQSMLKRLDELIEKNASTPAILDEMNRLGTQEIVEGRFEEYKEWWEASGVDVVSATLGAFGETPFTYENALRDIALWTRKFDSLSWLVKATGVKDIKQAKEEGKRAVILNFQNTTHIETDLNKLDFFYNLGVRIIQLTYNMRNFVGDGCTERTDAGLSHFGIQVVKRMNELGILVDLSHCGHKTTMDAIEISTKPVAFTHVFCRKLNEHDRGKTDEELKALAEKGGYCGIVVVPFFLAKESPSLGHFLAHLEHAIEIMGIDKVGVGTDWGATPKPLQVRLNEEIKRLGFREEHKVNWDAVTEGFKDWREWPNITCGLVSRGYSDSEIKGILGNNFLNIFSKVVG
ncbi:dipeptidase [Candidatus Acetothermia bacterium]|jgi:membrane dipeptidase|nr:dipeptidase [Candidatus Acetothermia bacterium]